MQVFKLRTIELSTAFLKACIVRRFVLKIMPGRIEKSDLARRDK